MPREMPSFEKSPADLVERFRAFATTREDLEPRQMFGYPCAFVGGNLTTGLYQASWFVRLPAADEAELRALGGGSFEPMAGRPMRGYVTVPGSVLDDPASLSGWVDRAVAFVRTLPDKSVKTSAKRSTTSSPKTR